MIRINIVYLPFAVVLVIYNIRSNTYISCQTMSLEPAASQRNLNSLGNK